MRRFRWVIIPVLFIVISTMLPLASTGAAQAETGKPGLEELTTDADSVIVGTVVERTSRWNDERTQIYTSVVVSVEESLKGEVSQDSITITVPGGEVGEIGQWVSHVPSFDRGERAVLFLKKPSKAQFPEAQFEVCGGFRGKLAVKRGKVGNLPLAKFKGRVSQALQGQALPDGEIDLPSSPATFPFSYAGFKWPGSSPVVSYRINQNTLDCTGEGAAVQTAAATWTAAPANFSFSYAGATGSTSVGYNGVNEIMWTTSLGGGIIAQATIWYSGSTILENDIQFQDNYTWSIGASAGAYDVETIALHELGHWLCLDDLYNLADSAKVMYGYGSTGTTKRALHADDIAGIQSIYGVAAATPPTVTNFRAADGEDGQSTLTWTNPSDADLAQVLVKRKTGSYPANHTDGTTVYDNGSPTPGGSVNTADSSLANGTCYYYAVFSKNSYNWNDTVQAGSNADTGTPGTPPLSRFIWKDSAQLVKLDSGRTTAMGGYVDIDLGPDGASAVSENAKFAIMEAQIYISALGSSSECSLWVRKNGTTTNVCPCIKVFSWNKQGDYVLGQLGVVGLDTGQAVEYKVFVPSGVGWRINTYIYVLGYIE